MRKQRPPRTYEQPMAFRRTFLAIVVVIGGFFLIRVLTSSPGTPLAELSPQQLATSMGTALLRVHSMTVTVASQIESDGQVDAVGGSVSVERNGNFQYSAR